MLTSPALNKPSIVVAANRGLGALHEHGTRNLVYAVASHPGFAGFPMATRPDDTTKRLSRNYIFTIWIGATVLIASILLVSLFALYQ